MISFAGGLPAPELFDGPGTRAAFAAALDDAAVGRTLQYSTTEGDPALRAAVAARLDRPRAAHPRRRAADHERLPAGADADRDRAARAGRHGARRGAVLPRRAAGLPARGRDDRARAVRRRRDRPGGRGRAGRAARRAAALHDPDVPEPDRAHAAARAPRGARRARARAAASGCSRTTPTASCATAASRCRRSPRSTTACSRSRRCRRSPRPGCGSAGCARPSRCAAR